MSVSINLFVSNVSYFCKIIVRIVSVCHHDGIFGKTIFELFMYIF